MKFLLCSNSPAASFSCTSITFFSASEKMCVGRLASGWARLSKDTPRV